MSSSTSPSADLRDGAPDAAASRRQAATIASLRARLAKAEAVTVRDDDAARGTDAADAAAAELEERLAAATSQHRSQLAKVRAQAAANLAELRAENDSLVEQLETSGTTAPRADADTTARLKREAEQLRAELDDALAEVSRLEGDDAARRRELSAAKREAASAQRQAESLREEVDGLEADLEAARRAADETRDLKREVARLKRAAAAAAASRDSDDAPPTSSPPNKGSRSGSGSTGEAAAAEETRTLRREVSRLQRQVDTLEAAAAERGGADAGAARAASEQAREVERLGRDLKVLQAHLRAAESARDEALDEASTAEGDLRALAEKFDALAAAHAAELERFFEKRSKERKRHKALLEAAEDEARRLKTAAPPSPRAPVVDPAEFARLEADLRTRADELAAAESQLAEVRRDLDEARGKATRASSEHAAELRRLRQQVGPDFFLFFFFFFFLFSFFHPLPRATNFYLYSLISIHLRFPTGFRLQGPGHAGRECACRAAR
jgi:chromosome segregation ATPase